MKLALPAEVPLMPSCWKLDATASAVPQHTPPISSIRRLPGVCGTLVSVALRRNAHTTTVSAKAAMIDRAALKVKGSRYSAPTLWATKAVPQISAANTGNTF